MCKENVQLVTLKRVNQFKITEIVKEIFISIEQMDLGPLIQEKDRNRVQQERSWQFYVIYWSLYLYILLRYKHTHLKLFNL